MEKKFTQTDAILNHMREHGGITSMEAFELYGATRLSAIIFGLRKRGFNILTEEKECVTRFGQKTKYAKYYLSNITN